ncbi:MAG: 7TM-DISM domain-containing protein, partial [Oscillospiraceae bacterium]|nr:7TM-DISM domain-containing protein [Oscillospiraceae bacterium]
MKKWLQNKRHLPAIIYLAGLIALLILIAIFSLPLKVETQSFTAGVKKAINITYRIGEGELIPAVVPSEISDLKPRTPVTVYTSIEPTNNDSLRIETIYTSLNLYADDTLIYSCGQPGSYPKFLIDPPTIITIIPLPDSVARQELRFEYISPEERSAISLPKLVYGEASALLAAEFREYGISVLLAMFFLLIGIVMSGTACVLSRKLPSASIFIYLGLFALTIGVWAFGECPFTAFLFPYPALLYMMSYCGLFLFAPPFLRFLELALKPTRVFVFYVMRYFLSVLILIAFFLQIIGKVSLAHNLYLYNIIIPVMLLTVLGLAIREIVRFKNYTAKRFVLPTIVIIAFALLAILNYEIRFIESIILIFQIGAFIFFLQLATIGVRYVQEASRAISEKTILEIKIEDMNRQIDAQRKQYERLATNSEQVKAMRHDLRHQFTAFISYCESGDLEGLKQYLDKLADGLPLTITDSYCENYAWNAGA